MAGIGFVLKKLVEKDNLSGLARAYGHAMLATSGPWLFTVLALGSLYYFTAQNVLSKNVDTFRLVILYNFCFSLVFSAPMATLATRYLADCIYKQDIRQAPGMMLGAVGMQLTLLAPLSLLFYFGYARFSFETALAAAINFLFISTIWVVSVFISALKNYNAISLSFLGGMLLAVIFTSEWAEGRGAAGLLAGFTVGLGAILGSLLALIFAEYPKTLRSLFGVLPYFKRHWEVGLSGLFFSMAIWADKWVMWSAPEAQLSASGLATYPCYDSAMFLAYMTVIPAMAMFMLSQETAFFEKYVKFYRNIKEHANFHKILSNQQEIRQSLLYHGRNLVFLQLAACFAAMLFAPALFRSLTMGCVQISIFRFGVLGAAFQVLTLFMTIILAYFEERRGALMVNSTFLITNILFTWVSLQMGFSYYGYGYFLAALTSFLLAGFRLEKLLRQLPYHAFVTANAAVQEQKERSDDRR